MKKLQNLSCGIIAFGIRAEWRGKNSPKLGALMGVRNGSWAYKSEIGNENQLQREGRFGSGLGGCLK